MDYRVVGSPVLRKEVRGKLTGSAAYVDDISLPGMLHGATVRSSVPRGRIRAITFAPGIPWHEFTIVTASDIPGKNIVALIYEDQPYLASEYVNHLFEPILLLAHEDEDLLRKARTYVQIDYDPLAAVFDTDESLQGEEIIWGEDNVFKRSWLIKATEKGSWTRRKSSVKGKIRPG